MASPTAYQYGLIKSQHNNFYLDVEGGKAAPETGVCCWERNNGDNQIWYCDANNSVIRSKMNDFVLEYSQGKQYFVINPFKPDNLNQKWRFDGGYIRNLGNPNLVFSLPGQSKEKGTKIISSLFTGQPDQLWTFEYHGGPAPSQAPVVGPGYSYGAGHEGGFASNYTAPAPNFIPQYQPQQQPPFVPQPTAGPAVGPGAGAAVGCGQMPLPDIDFEKREFVIKSEMDDKVLDIKGDDAKEGALLCMYKPHRKKNQLWYFDKQGFIRSSLNDFVFYAKDRGSSLKMVPYVNDPKHQWRMEGNKILNGERSCLDIRGGKCSDGAELCAYEYKAKSNQHWKIEHY